MFLSLRACAVQLFAAGLVLLLAQSSAAQSQAVVRLIKAKDFLALQPYAAKPGASPVDQLLAQAFLQNALGRPDASQQAIKRLRKQLIPSDSLGFLLQQLAHDNHAKRFEYAQAYAVAQDVLTRFSSHFSADERQEWEQQRTLWGCLRSQPRQRLTKAADTRLPLTRDKARLWNIPVQAHDSAYSFVFDTGAGFSCATQTMARRLGLRLIDKSQVPIRSGITGATSLVQLGLAPTLTIGHITAHNVVFLVFPDSAFSFAKGAYKINGIIGFPVIREFGELRITKTHLEVPRQPTMSAREEANMVLDLLKPILYLHYQGRDLPFTFDTGANFSLFSDNFYHLHQAELQQSGTAKTIRHGGAGGSHDLPILEIPELRFEVHGLPIVFRKAQVSTLPIETNGTTYFGNVGQDLINQFEEMTISFERACIRFK